MLAMDMDNSTLSCAVNLGIRLKNWKTNPIFSRISASWLSFSLPMSAPSISRVPDVGLSKCADEV